MSEESSSFVVERYINIQIHQSESHAHLELPHPFSRTFGAYIWCSHSQPGPSTRGGIVGHDRLVIQQILFLWIWLFAFHNEASRLQRVFAALRNVANHKHICFFLFTQ